MRARFVGPAFASALALGLVVFTACVGSDPDATGNAAADAGTDTSTSSSGGSSSGSPGEDAATDGSSGGPIDSGDAGKVRYFDRVKQDGPKAYYRLDENAGTGLIDAVGTNNGNYYGTYTLNVVGALTDDTNPAVSFTDGCARAGDIFNFNGAGSSFTLEAWVKPTGVTGVRVIAGKFNSYSGAQNGYKLQVMPTNTLRMTSTASDDRFDTTNVIPMGQYTHVAATHDGTTGRIYINGVEAASSAIPLPPLTGVPFTVGCDYDTTTGNNNVFIGAIDEVAVYDKALDAATINQHYLAR